MTPLFNKTWKIGAWCAGALCTFGGVYSAYEPIKLVIAAIPSTANLKPLQLVNIDAHPIVIEDRRTGGEAPAYQFSIILHNPNYALLYVVPGEVNAILAGVEMEPSTEARKIIGVPHGIDVEYGLPEVRVQLPHDRAIEGRIVIQMRYGLERNKIDKSIVVKGAVTIRFDDGQMKLRWEPDDDSALPTGLQPHFELRRT